MALTTDKPRDWYGNQVWLDQASGWFSYDCLRTALLCKIKSLIVVNKEEFLLCTFLRMGYSPEQMFSPDSSA